MAEVRTPLILINAKAYTESMGSRGLAQAKICEEVANETGASIVYCPQQQDLALVAKDLSIPVFGQSADNKKVGSSTGYITPEALKESGAAGTLMNHAEHQLLMSDTEALVQRCRKAGIVTILCANNLATCKACAALGPDFVSIEPPELIGGDISVTTADPEIVSATAKAVKAINPDVKVLCGAGVKDGNDAKKAIELGAEGVMLASGFVKSSNPKGALQDIVTGIQKA